MGILLQLSRLIDWVNERVGRTLYWLILAAVLVSAVNAVVRYTFDVSSNAWLELQWYLFSAVFIGCAGYTLLRNEHIRIDIIISRFPKKVQIWIDIVGGFVALLPMTIIIMVLSWPIFTDSFARQEMSANAGGLLQWPFKLFVPVGFFMLMLQGFSEIIKRVAYLMGLAPDPSEKGAAHGVEAEHPPQHPVGS
ncbi:MAG TPA: TRAP transporter small permease subunit [Candidatus Cybelea sp.]|nr:TRAP transporter small permease subunit [Candidatus Cybelea sp.]